MTDPILNTLASKRNCLRAQIIFGSPTKGCEGMGVCKVFPHGVDMARFACPSAPAWLSFSERSGFCMTFLRHELSQDIYARYFASPLFLVEYSCPIPTRMSNRLGMPGPFSIGPGQYHIQKTKLCLQLIFTN